jgi:predicted TPR repeat methyltransferase
VDARRLYEAGRLAQAETACRTALAREPGHADLLQLLGLIALRTSRPEAALELLGAAARRAPRDPTLRNHLALACIALKRTAQARDYLRESVSLDWQQAETHNDLADCLKELGDLEAAEASYRDALAIAPRYLPARCNLGQILMLRRQYAQARDCFEAAVAIEPQMAAAWVLLGRALVILGKFDEAIASYRRAIALEPALAAAHLSLGNALRIRGQPQAAEASYRRAIELSPTEEGMYQMLAVLQLNAGRYEEAEQTLQAALAVRSGSRNAQRMLAIALACRGDRQAAIDTGRKACADAESEASICWRIARDLCFFGKVPESVPFLQRIEEVDPGDASAASALAALSSNPEHLPTDFVSSRFDQYADRFDEHLGNWLQCRIPQEMVALLQSVSDTSQWDVLDLGCGTGLVGTHMAPRARRLVGVDLSENMLAQARRLNVYHELQCADLLDVLRAAESASYDVITAADVFVYVGKLEEVVRAARRVLRPHGLLAFTVEAAGQDARERPGYRLAALTGRYVHSDGYLRVLADSNGFSPRASKCLGLRLERERPVDGRLLVWEAS